MSGTSKLIDSKKSFFAILLIGFVGLPMLYGNGVLSIGDINMLGRYMTFAILAL